jgi:hypothetical protein
MAGWAWNEATNGGIFRISRAMLIASVADETMNNPATGHLFDGFISSPNITTGRLFRRPRRGLQQRPASL